MELLPTDTFSRYTFSVFVARLMFPYWHRVLGNQTNNKRLNTKQYSELIGSGGGVDIGARSVVFFR